MIHIVVACCLWVGAASGYPLYGKGLYALSSPGGRPACATKSLTFCEDVDKYPTKLIQTLLQSKQLDMYDMFTDESEGLEEPPEYILHQDMIVPSTKSPLNSRKERSVANTTKTSMDYSNCPVESKLALPKYAANSNGEWRFIAQDEESKFHQKIKVQLCDESEECRKSCFQFYATVPMVTISKDGPISKDMFWMPSSCQCIYHLWNTT